MSTADAIAAIGLAELMSRFGASWHGLTAGPVQNVRGSLAFVGTSRPLLSSAARLGCDQATVWIPAPELPAACGLAPIYLHAGRRYVLPFIRLLETHQVEEGLPPPSFLLLDHWIGDACTRWQFRRLDGNGTTTLVDQLESEASVEVRLRALALMIRYALFGSDAYSRLCGLAIPPCQMWLRPVPPTRLGALAARSLVISARLAQDDDESNDEVRSRPLVPSTRMRSDVYRLDPSGRDLGIDPVHTPEGPDIRFTGRLGVGVAVSANRRLVVPANLPNPCPLSASTERIPFAGYNDPRRLLMAANMQLQAIDLVQSESPIVRNGEGVDPPGVNLRVGYLAWQGWNHEDAWVISASAAARLAAAELTTHTIAIRSIELPPEMLVKPGDQVKRGALLIARRAAPCFLSSSLPVLARLSSTDAIVPLQPEVGDHAEHEGTVLRIETTDLMTPSAEGEVRGPVSSAYRTLYEISIRRDLPLRVGDKLANRHGHKGIVGAILPDEAMPRWNGRPLEALIDPISVLNRSNWGQLKETIAGSDGEGDAVGRSTIQPPTDGSWLSSPVQAVAGVQFILRLPQHSADKISGAPVRGAAAHIGLRSRAQRFGEMDSWAAWAHGAVRSRSVATRLSSSAARLQRLLAAGGFDLSCTPTELLVRRFELSTEQWSAKDFRRLEIEKGTLAEAVDLLADIDALQPAAIVFDPPVADIHWLPVLPPCDRLPRRQMDGSEQEHELTREYRQIVRLARQAARPQPATETHPAEADDLRQSVARVMRLAYALSLGLSATGQSSSKLSWLRRGVLGQRLKPSARATIAPAGTLGLALDEIGLPAVLAPVLFGALPPDGEQRRVWLKRDPVLHRWGLLPVRVRLVEGDAVRLPASLLGPLGADFDGDTVGLFAALPGVREIPSDCTPAPLAWHPLLQEPMFLPAKQYVYGLHLLQGDPERLARLQQAFQAAGAPAWPTDGAAKKRLSEWVRQATSRKPEAHWWGILEQVALDALSNNPGADLGLYSQVEDLAALDVVSCGAAKNLYEGPQDRSAVQSILDGDNLAMYQRRNEGTPRGTDPIADVMVAGKTSIGQFGGALRRILYSASSLTPSVVQAAQCLTERITQKALSVKAGRPVVSHTDFERELRRLLRGETWQVSDDSELGAILAPFKHIWEELRSLMPREQAAWLRWLRAPHELTELLPAEGKQILRLAINDLRILGWFEPETEEPAALARAT